LRRSFTASPFEVLHIIGPVVWVIGKYRQGSTPYTKDLWRQSAFDCHRNAAMRG
jgi:hypothetical protein